MDKPLCRLCAHKHYKNEPHILKMDNGSTIVAPTGDKMEGAEISIQDGKLVKKFDRVAYQREYMRKRRAKK